MKQTLLILILCASGLAQASTNASLCPAGSDPSADGVCFVNSAGEMSRLTNLYHQASSPEDAAYVKNQLRNAMDRADHPASARETLEMSVMLVNLNRQFPN